MHRERDTGRRLIAIRRPAARLAENMILKTGDLYFFPDIGVNF
jgi:hypothetical protein